jgi:MtN3 and saliva related transmembrane protein
MTQLLGLTAGLFTTIAFLPQVIKTWKMRSAKDLSLSTFSLFFTGVMMWLIYGIMKQDLPVILSNLFTLILAGVLLYFKIRFK